jgi:hypothetical protein
MLFMRLTIVILLWSLLLPACTLIRLYNGSTEERRISIVSSDSTAFNSESGLIDRYKKSPRVTTDVTLTKMNSGCILEFSLRPGKALEINNLIMPGPGHDQSDKFFILNRVSTQDTLISLQSNNIQKRLFRKKFMLLWTVYYYQIK